MTQKEILLLMIKNSVIFILIILIFPYNSFSQSLFSQFRKLSCPEKCWVVSHPFVAKKASKISRETQAIIKSLANDTTLDGDQNGGQLDAFRHCLWMALLVNEINFKKVKKLGNAHEKGNFLEYKKKKTEDGTVPDYISSQMDYLNNDIGIYIGLNKNISTRDSLIKYIKNEIIEGNLWIIKKDKRGNFISCDNELIKIEDLIGLWINKKCLVKSNFVRPF